MHPIYILPEFDSIINSNTKVQVTHTHVSTTEESQISLSFALRLELPLTVGTFTPIAYNVKAKNS